MAKNICAEDLRIASWQIDWENQGSIHNWISKPDLMCAPKLKIGLVGSSFFIGWALTTTWLPRFADLYGRKNLYKISQVCDLLIFTAIFFAYNLETFIALIFFIGVLTSLRINVGFIYMLEFIPKRSQAYFGTAWCIIDASIMLWVTIYFINSTIRDWRQICLAGYFC